MSRKETTTKIARVLTPFLLLGIAAGIAVWLVKTKSEPEKQKPSKSQLLVETIEAESGRHLITVEAMGSVEPDEEVDLNPEVTGLVVWKNPDLIEGGIVQKGEALLRIDHRDYEVAVKEAESSLQQAEVDYQLELSRQAVAAEEWNMLEGEDGPLKEANKSLALREPQLKAAAAKLQAASNALAKAELDMERTEIEAPFNAIVLQKNVDRGQLVSPQTKLASLAGTDSFLVEAKLPSSKLQFMDWPAEDGSGGPPVEVVYELGETDAVSFEGRLIRVLGNLGETGRLAQILVRVEDPLNLEDGDLNQRLFANAYVRCIIEGQAVEETFKLPSFVVREGGEIWIMDANDQLEIKDVEILWRQGGNVLIEKGLKEGDRVISSHIAVPMPGMDLKEKGAEGGEKSPKSGKVQAR